MVLVELCVEPAGLCGRCTGVAVPLRVVPSSLQYVLGILRGPPKPCIPGCVVNGQGGEIQTLIPVLGLSQMPAAQNPGNSLGG